jgi:hypothetical protein
MVRKYRQAEVVIPYPGQEEIVDISRNVSIRAVKDKNVILTISPLTLEWFISKGYDFTIAEKKGDSGIISSPDVRQAMDWNSYPTYKQYDSIMRYFVSEYPSLCKLDTIGTSLNGKLVLALKISDNCSDDEDEPEVFYTSSMHGDETGGYVLMLRLSEYLLKNYSLSARIKNLIDNLEIWINPLANPDGTYNNGDEIDLPVRGNANGVDLNRNFPDPLSSGIVQEKETLDMMKFLTKHRFALSANFHSGTEVVNYPWDRWFRDHADKNWFYNVSRAYADTVHLYSPAGYMDFLDNGVTNGYRWYPVFGGRQDYVTYELQGRELTIELDDDYITPAYELNELWESNRRSLLDYIESALYGIHGYVYDLKTGRSVPAKINISGHDKDNSHVYADTLTGRFVRPIEPEVWDLTFTAEGYRDTTLHDISVIHWQTTNLNVEMTPDVNPVDTTDNGQPILYPNPASGIIKALLPREVTGLINIKVFTASGKVLADYDTEAVEGTPLQIDISSMPAAIYIVRFSDKDSGLSFSSRFIVIR